MTTELGLCSFSDRKKRDREGKRQKNCETAKEKRNFQWPVHFFHVKSFLGRTSKLVILLSEEQIEEVCRVTEKTAARWGNFDVKHGEVKMDRKREAGGYYGEKAAPNVPECLK